MKEMENNKTKNDKKKKKGIPKLVINLNWKK
jgi:hypothetical protein